jgi:hypothetical protein
MKAKASNKKHEVMSVMAVVQPSPSQTKKKAQKTKVAATAISQKQLDTEIYHWLNVYSGILGDTINQISNMQKGLKQLASLVRANYTLK